MAILLTENRNNETAGESQCAFSHILNYSSELTTPCTQLPS